MLAIYFQYIVRYEGLGFRVDIRGRGVFLLLVSLLFVLARTGNPRFRMTLSFLAHRPRVYPPRPLQLQRDVPGKSAMACRSYLRCFSFDKALPMPLQGRHQRLSPLIYLRLAGFSLYKPPKSKCQQAFGLKLAGPRGVQEQASFMKY